MNNTPRSSGFSVLSVLSESKIKNEKNEKNKTRKIYANKGGRRFGKGFKGSVLDICNHKKKDMDNLCKQLESKDIETIIIYVSQKNRFQVPITLQKSEEITAFIDFLSSSNTQNYVAKEFYNYLDK